MKFAAFIQSCKNKDEDGQENWYVDGISGLIEPADAAGHDVMIAYIGSDRSGDSPEKSANFDKALGGASEAKQRFRKNGFTPTKWSVWSESRGKLIDNMYHSENCTPTAATLRTALMLLLAEDQK